MKFLDLFAGIGGFRLGLERAGHTCVGFCEIDKYARQTYKANFDTKGEIEWHDITTVTDVPLRGVDILTGGFPCQSFSVAGQRRGFDDARGTLFFEIARVARILQPKYLLLENVKGLLAHEGGETFRVILSALGELGYWWEFQICNSKNFGVPQHRERVFIVGHLRGAGTRAVFPIRGEDRGAVAKEQIDASGIYTNVSDAFLRKPLPGLSRTLKANKHDAGIVVGAFESRCRFYGADGVSPTLNTMQGGDRQPKVLVKPCLSPDRSEKRQHGRRFKEDGDPSFTVTAQDRHGVKVDERIRRLTPLECFRLQGFPDSHYHNAKKAGVSDSQLYKQAGNAVTVNVVEAIGRRLYK